MPALVCNTNRVTPLLYVLLPQQVPSDLKAIEWCAANPSQVPLPSRVPMETSNVTVANELAKVFEYLDRTVTSHATEQTQSDDSAHDSYFCIGRVAGDEAGVFAQMTAHARLILLRDVEEHLTGIDKRDLQTIDQSLADLTACMAGGRAASAQGVTNWESRSERRDPMQRWVRGHQLFAALTQGLIFSFQSMGRALRTGHGDDAARWADLSISLLRGSGATLRYTGDFAPEEYRQTIRPTMSPPVAPICLSGLMSSDHRFFVQLAGKMKPALKVLREHEPFRHEQIHDAVASMYDSHIHVCEKFVGDQPSLLTAGRTEKSGPELVEHFKNMRMQPFESRARATRVVPAAPA